MNGYWIKDIFLIVKSSFQIIITHLFPNLMDKVKLFKYAPLTRQVQ